MSATALRAPATESPDFVAFLRRELAPSPARWQATLRLTLACVVATIPVMSHHIHAPLLVMILVYLITKEETTVTVLGSVLGVVGLTIGCALLLLYYATALDLTWLRVCLVPVAIFGSLYLNRIFTLGPLGTMIGIPLWLGMIVPDVIPNEEVLARLPFWLWWSAVLGLGTNLGVELLLNPSDPRDTLARALAGRLAAVEAAIARAISGEPAGESGPAAAHAARGLDAQLKQLKLAMFRHGELKRYRAELAALVALVDRMVGAAAALEALGPLELSDGERERLHRVATASAEARLAIASLRWPDADTAREAASVVPGPTAIAPLAEMERLVAMLPLALPGGGGVPAEFAPPASHGGLLAPDALTNPEYRRFAVKGAIAATVCYLIFTGADYPGIYTSVITCAVCSVSTIGANVQKGTLRFAGACVGGALGVLTLVYIFPHLDSLGGFWIPFSAVTALAAYVNFGSPRLAYCGYQIALAFYKCVLQSYGPTVHLTVIRDRLVGIALGLTVFWLVDSRLWPVPATDKLRARIADALKSLADLAIAGGDGPSARIDQVRARVYGDLAAVQQLLIETKFERDVADREALDRVFAATETALLLLAARTSPTSQSARRRAGASALEAWHRLDDAVAAHLRSLGDRVEGTQGELISDPAIVLSGLERAVAKSPARSDAALVGQLALDRRLVETIARIGAAVPGRAMNVALYTSVLTLVGLIIGAALQYHFNRAIDVRRQVILARTECYADYIRCIAQYVHVVENPAKLAKWNAQVLEARARICIYGSHDVIKALARFERSSDPVLSDAYVDNVVNVLAAMREHTDERRPRGLRDELRAALFRNLNDSVAAEDLRRVGMIGYKGATSD